MGLLSLFGRKKAPTTLPTAGESVLDRVARILRANAHAALDKAEDPLATLDLLVLLDEFEKIFSDGEGDSSNRQNQFLSLFDGTSSVKRMYCITVNSLNNTSTYLVNRPGRFHYHIRFGYPGAAEIREYVKDKAPKVTDCVIDEIVRFSSLAKLNYDHLRAIAFELEDGQSTLGDVIDDLNIKAVEVIHYNMKVYLEGREQPLVDLVRLDLLNMDAPVFTNYVSGYGLQAHVGLNKADLRFGEDGVAVLHKGQFRDYGQEPDEDNEDDDSPKRPAVERIEFTKLNQASLGYSQAF